MTQPAGRPMVPEDLLRIRSVSDPQMHPDGRRVAFVVTMLSEVRDEYLSTIWIVDVAGGEPRQFTRGSRRDTAPRWSSDGQWLAFVSEREKKGKGQLYVMPADGGEPVRLTDLRPGVTSPAWSPDGQWLAFVSRVGGWEEPTDEDERDRSKPPRIIDILRYKSNGVGFVYDRPQQIFVVPAAGGPVRQLTEGSFENHHPTWAPDGQHVAFVSARHDERDEDSAADIYTVPVGGGAARQITRTMGPVSWPVYSADGRTVAYIGHAHARAVSRHHRLYTVPAVGGAPRCLTESLDRNCEPMTGASTGASPLTSASRESMRTSGLPPNRSRTMAMATTPPAAAPKPWSRRKTLSHTMSGASAAATDAAMCSAVARISGRRRPTLSLHGPTMSWPNPKPTSPSTRRPPWAPCTSWRSFP